MKKFLKFWGTRGSCPVSGEPYSRYGGNTCCAEIVYGKSHLIIDAGTGIRPLGERFSDDQIDLFFGHTHLDHIAGLPFFDPLYRSNMKINIWSQEKNSEHVLHSVFTSELFPVKFEELSAQLDFQTIHLRTPISIGELSIDSHAAHHPGGALCFKIQTPKQTIGYVTDNELFHGYQGTPQEISEKILAQEKELIAFFSPCDLLIHEAQYFPEEYVEKVGWGHSSLYNVIAFAEKLGAPQWLITHHDPKHTDRELDRLAKQAAELYSGSVKCVADNDTIDLM